MTKKIITLLASSAIALMVTGTAFSAKAMENEQGKNHTKLNAGMPEYEVFVADMRFKNFMKDISQEQVKEKLSLRLDGYEQILGSTMEKLLVAANNYVRYRDVSFTVVRYGNVIGSRGSVIPYWCELISKGIKQLPLTSPEMTRFVITLDEGVDLVIRALNQAAPGEVLIPKIPSIKMEDLAKVFPSDVGVEVVGIRPGEKLHESLIGEDEGRHTYDAGSHYVIAPEFEFARDSGVAQVGTPVPKGFHYRSDLNSQWLHADEMRPIVNDWLRQYGLK